MMKAVYKLDKILAQPDPTADLISYVGSGEMAKYWPELQTMVEFKTKRPSKYLWGHVLAVVKKVPHGNAVLRWAALFHDVGKPATVREDGEEVTFHGHEVVGEQIWRRVAKRINSHGYFADAVALLIRTHLRFAACAGAPGLSDRAIRKLLREADNQLENLYILTIADITSSNDWKVMANQKRCKELKERIDKLIEDDKKVIPKLPKGTGHVLMDCLGLKGPELGRVMGILNEQLQAGEDINLDNVAHKAALFLKEEKEI